MHAQDGPGQRDLRIAFPDHRCSRGGGCLACIYARISEDREGEELGVNRQDDDCKGLAEALGVPVGQTFVDDDISASTGPNKRRPDYEGMLAAVERGTYCTILA